ncbi:MAG: molybdopterin cofactor-binding domain-containing protein [Steroidobacteraceae bacterium]
MSVTRRHLLKSGAGLVFCLTLYPPGSGAETPDRTGKSGRTLSVQLNAYVHVRSDGVVVIHYPSAEMGQGVMTALPLIVAEEMDADWERVEVSPSPPVGDEYGDPVFINLIFTVGSRSVAAFFERLRLFGAQARRVLLQNAATRWGVPPGELHTRPHQVIHAPSGRSLGYGEIAALPAFVTDVPQVVAADLKAPDHFRLIGTDVEPRALRAKLDGSMQYSIDVAPPGVLHAAVIRAPVTGSRIAGFDDTAARDLAGVVDIFRQDDRVAVVARSYHEALRAKRLVKVTWADVPAADGLDSEILLARNAEAARNVSAAGFPWDRAGEPESRFIPGSRLFEREYQTDYMYHGGLEPLNAVVSVSTDGRSAEAWVGTQAPKYTVDKIAEIAGIDPAAVTLHRCPMGGAFGRRSVYVMDFVQDAAWLSARLRKPVKVIWDREEDFKLGYLRPMTGQLIRASLREDGSIAAWHHRIACEDPIKVHEPLLWQAWQQIPLIGMLGSEHRAEDGAEFLHAYDLPQRLVEYVAVESGIRVYAMRGVGAMPGKFAIESFVDEAAAESRTDPLAYRLALLHRSPRARHVLETAAAMAHWGQRQEGRALGLAYSHYAGTLIGCVAEVSVDAAAGEVRVHNVWAAVDAGIVVQPDNFVAQIEGGVIYGLSNALLERITIGKGQIQQSNFSNYPLLRLDAAPRVHVHVVKSVEPPTGIGEIGTVVTPAAMANAFAALTGRRIRQLPFTSERVHAALR